MANASSQAFLHHVIGGGTWSDVRHHFSLGVRAKGTTARYIHKGFLNRGVASKLHLTQVADTNSNIVTDTDVAKLVAGLVQDPTTKMIVFNAAIVDFHGQIGDVPSGKHAPRLQSRDAELPVMRLTPADKIISTIRQQRKDIFLVGFKATCGKTPDEQYAAGLRLVKEGHVNVVLANDEMTRLNMVVVPEEARYFETTNRQEALDGLVNIALSRSVSTFTRSTVLKDEPRVAWDSDEVPDNLRGVVNHLIARGAYKPFLGKTAGHFAVRGKEPNEFLTSARQENFNHLAERGLVRVFAQSADEVVAHAAKPSVGGQSQRIIFTQYPELDSIVHFHAPMRPDAEPISVRPQWMHECGSHQCGQNTANGLREVRPGIHAVMLDNHGPNIVFGKDVLSGDVIDLIERNWDLGNKTGGLIPASMRAAPELVPA